MYLSQHVTLTASPETIHELMCDADFQQQKADRIGALDFSMNVQETAQHRTVTTKRVTDASGVPEFIKSMVKPKITVTETEVWTLAPDAPLGGDFNLDIQGAPVKLRGTVRIDKAPQGATLTFEGELSTSVPLFKKQIEEAASEQVLHTIATEFELLQRHSAAV